MSVEFAQQTELSRINKSACQTSTSMQTQSDEEEAEIEEQIPRACLTTGAWLEEVERERLERELEEKNAEIRKLKEELQSNETAPEKVSVDDLLSTLTRLTYLIHFIYERSLLLSHQFLDSQCRNAGVESTG